MLLAMIARFDIGLLTWSAIGMSLGYAVSLFSTENSPRLVVPIILGMIGGVLGGGAAGMAMEGYELWISNVAAIAGAAALSIAWEMVKSPGPTDEEAFAPRPERPRHGHGH